MSEGKKPDTPIPKTVKVKQLQRELKKETSKWQELGFQLQVSTNDLKKIEKDANKKSPKMCLVAAIEYWLTNGDDKTWQVIFDALEDDHGRLKRELENQYHPDMEVTLNSTQLVNLLEDVVPGWYIFGQNIDVPTAKLKAFSDAKAPDQCFSEMLQKWLSSGGATWEGLVEALIRINNRKLAKEIEKKYIRDIPDNTSKGQRIMWYVGIDKEELEEEEHFLDVLQAVTSVVKWEELGLALKLKPHQLQEIKRDEQTVADCRKAMLGVWLREGEASWKNLCLALDNDVVGEKKLARDIARKHRVPGNYDNALPDQSANIPYPQQESMETDVPGAAFDYGNSMSSAVPSAPPESQVHDMSQSSGGVSIQMSGSGHMTNPPSHVTNSPSHVTNPSIQPANPQSMSGYDNSRIGHATMLQDTDPNGHHSFVHVHPQVPNPQHLQAGNYSGPYHDQNLPGQAVIENDMEQPSHVTNPSIQPANPQSMSGYDNSRIHVGHATMPQDTDPNGHHSFVHAHPQVPNPNLQHLQAGNYSGPYHDQNLPGQAVIGNDMEQQSTGHHSLIPTPNPVPPYNNIHQATSGPNTSQAEMVYREDGVHQNTSSVFTTAHSVSGSNN